MTPRQKLLVRSSFARLAPVSALVASGFYTRLFEMDPSLRLLFKVEMKVQEQKFMQMLTTIVASMDPLEEVIPVVWPMGKRHVGYGVRPEHYVTVGSALLETLEAQLGADFCGEICEAWTAAYALLSLTMQHAADTP